MRSEQHTKRIYPNPALGSSKLRLTNSLYEYDIVVTTVNIIVVVDIDIIINIYIHNNNNIYSNIMTVLNN